MSDQQYPYIEDDMLHVKCDHSECDRTTSVPVTVTASEYTNRNPEWTVSFTSGSDGFLEITSVECPNHNIERLVEQLAESQRTFTRSFNKTARVVSEL